MNKSKQKRKNTQKFPRLHDQLIDEDQKQNERSQSNLQKQLSNEDSATSLFMRYVKQKLVKKMKQENLP